MTDHIDSPHSDTFTSKVTEKLKDSRFWLIAGASLFLCGLVVVFFKEHLASVLTLGISLAASYLIRQIDDLPKPRGNFAAATFYEKTITPAVVGLVMISGSDIFARVWHLPWYWLHGEDAVPRCSFLLSTAAVDWLGLVLSAVFVATLMGRRTDFAIMFGLAFYIPLNITDVLRGQLAEKSGRLMASSCPWLADDPSGIALGAFRWGMATGIVIRALTAILVARLIGSWRAARQNSSAGLDIK
jgi:hypothetical protein